jgi:hypothetical protein
MKIMKKSIFLLPCVVCAVVGMLLISCKKGDTGPAGATGAAGPAGPAGAAGVPGATGTANVMYSPWIDTTKWNVLDTFHVGTVIDTVFIADINVPKLTADILNQGQIQVYFNLNTTASPVIYALPFNNGNVFIDVVYAVNTIEMTTNLDLTGLPFRYVLIPGGTAARTYKSIDWKNYAEVKAYLGLKD